MKRIIMLAFALVLFIACEASAANREIRIENESYIIYAGKQQKITATTENLDETAPKQTTLVWSSSAPDVATVNNAGYVSGKNNGKAVITAQAKDDGMISASAQVEVRVPVQSLTINEKNVSVVVGGAEEAARTKLTVNIKPENAYHTGGTWTSSDENVAQVDSEGNVTGISAGNASITFTSDDPNGNRKAQIPIKVGQAVLAIQITGQGSSLPTGRTMQLKANAEPENATNKKVIWSSGNEAIASVNENGQVKGVAPGTATITATAADGSGVTASYEITVVSPVKKIALSDKKITLAPDITWQVTAEVTPEDATIKDLVWTSSNEKVATVDQNGMIKGIAKGSATITATAQDGSGVKINLSVTVKNFDIIITSPSGANVSYDTPNGIWGIAYRSKKHCVSEDGEHLRPLKAGEDTFTVLMQSYMTGKIRRIKFSVLVTPSAIR